MTDMLVRLYDLPSLLPIREGLRSDGIELRRALPAEKHIVIDWIAEHFDDHWASEVQVAFSRLPVACFLALAQNQILGFGCYDVACRNFFGPTGVLPEQQRRGIGKALLLACLHDMAAQGFAYGIIGGVGPIGFYEHAVGAIVIPDSTPGIYAGLLPGKPRVSE